MGEPRSTGSIALVVEDDPFQREALTVLLEESGFEVIGCESAEAAAVVLACNAGAISLLVTDVELAGGMDGIELAHLAHRQMPTLTILVTSGRPLVRALPDGSRFYPKPWSPLDMLREATR